MKLRLLAAACLFSGLLAAADPQLLNLVMPDAKFVAGINIDQARISPFGQYLLSHVQGHDRELQELEAATGFDPRRDLREVLVASAGEMGYKRLGEGHMMTGASGLALIRGTFDIPRILEAVRSKGQTSSEVYNGVQILNNKQNTDSFALVDSTLVIAGDAANVRAAIDRRSAPATLDPALASKVDQLSTTQDAWMVSLVPPSAIDRHVIDPDVQVALNGDVLKKIGQTSGGVKFGANILVSAEAVAQTDKDATALADVIRFLVSLAQLNAPSHGGSEAAALLQNLDVKAEANVTKVSLSIPEEQIERLPWGSSAHPSRPRLKQQ